MCFRKLTNKKISPRCNYIIWVVFIIALIFPVSLPSKMSIYNLVNIESIRNVEDEIKNDVLNYANENVDNRKENYHFDLKDRIKINNKTLLNNKALIFLFIHIWFIISIIKLIITIVVYFAMIKEVGNIEITDKRIIKIVNDCKKRLNIKRNIKIIYQDYIKVPSIVGIINVKILLTDMVFELSDEELIKVIMHELSHYKRKDNVMRFVIKIIKSFYWFNPIINIIFSYMKNDVEVATDFLAMSKIEDVDELEYCETIIKIAGIASSKNEYALGIVNAKKNLDDRINMIFAREYFIKYNKVIIGFTSFIILFMCLVMFPTSYSMLQQNEIYLEINNENQIVISNEIEKVQEVKIKSGDTVLLFFNNNKDKFIDIEKTDLSNNETYFQTIDSSIKINLDSGEYIYKFMLFCKNNTVTENYIVKFIVE